MIANSSECQLISVSVTTCQSLTVSDSKCQSESVSASNCQCQQMSVSVIRCQRVSTNFSKCQVKFLKLSTACNNSLTAYLRKRTFFSTLKEGEVWRMCFLQECSRLHSRHIQEFRSSRHVAGRSTFIIRHSSTCLVKGAQRETITNLVYRLPIVRI